MTPVSGCCAVWPAGERTRSSRWAWLARGRVAGGARRGPADPTGTVAGFADAHGDWLPLACTLNCTLAVDRVAALLGLDREAVDPVTGVTLLPYLDGERTPNLPGASGLLHGLRHDTTAGQLLQAAYDGAVHSPPGAPDPGPIWDPYPLL